jgi:hypothetical protein
MAKPQSQNLSTDTTHQGDLGTWPKLLTEIAVHDSFQYRALVWPNEMRIIILLPGSKNDPIECIICHTQLTLLALATVYRDALRGTAAGYYEALSYEWGQSSKDDPTVLLDGWHVRIRRNLHAALLQIRDPIHERNLWIDALSIDQANLNERNHQVRVMKDIYQSASRVIVWLGQPKDNSDLAMASFARKPTDSYSFGDDTVQDKAVIALCQRSYWRRVWVLQEFHNAQMYTVHCGNKSISAFMFHTFLAHLCSSIGGEVITRTAAYQHVIAKHGISQIQPAINTLRRWLLVCIKSGFQSTEPRDIVFAMLGIAQDCQNDEIIPDYNKPLLEVYIETVTFCQKTYSRAFACSLAKKLGISIDEVLLRRLADIIASKPFLLGSEWE